MKIVYVLDVLDTAQAGTENQLIKMIEGLRSRGIEISLVSLRNHPWLMENAASLNCEVVVFECRQFKRLKTYLGIIGLIRFLRARKPNIVHTLFPVANVVGVMAGWLAGIGNIVSSRRDYGEWMTGCYLPATRFANHFVKMIVTNSRRVKELTVSAEKIADNKIAVIYNGIDLAVFNNLVPDHDLKRRLGIPFGNKVVGKVANFRPMKHHQTFIMAASVVLKTRGDVDFLLVGTDAAERLLRPELEELARSLKIADRIHFVGSQKDVVPYLSIMDVGVNCSDGEGLSNAIMEYMAAGVPCVVSDGGGNPDLITHGIQGLTFSVGDHQTLAKHIITLFDNDVLRRECIERAREKVSTELTVSAMLARYEDFYRKMASSSAG